MVLDRHRKVEVHMSAPNKFRRIALFAGRTVLLYYSAYYHST